MTVESQVNKTESMVMGSSATYDFSFHVLLNDPTPEEAKQAIKVSVSNGKTTKKLEYGTDYTVTLNNDGNGGTVTVADMKTSDYSLIIYREYDFKQGSDYQNYNSFPADTLESDLDKNVMIAQQLNEKIGRAVTVDLFSNADPSELVSEIDALYQVKDAVVTAAENIGSIVTASNDIEAIKDAPAQASAALASASAASSSAAAAHIDANTAETSANAAALSASVAKAYGTAFAIVSWS